MQLPVVGQEKTFMDDIQRLFQACVIDDNGDILLKPTNKWNIKKEMSPEEVVIAFYDFETNIKKFQKKVQNELNIKVRSLKDLDKYNKERFIKMMTNRFIDAHSINILY